MFGLFVHDHKFPKKNNQYYYSYGFDKEFFNRYIDIFGEIGVIGRYKESDNNKKEMLVRNVSFFTIKELNQLKYKKVRKKIIKKVKEADYIIIRVPSILGLYVAWLAKKMKKPYIIEVVGCYWDAVSTKGFSKFIPAIIVTTLMKLAVYFSHYVVYVTEEFLERRYPTRGKHIACSNVTLHSVTTHDLEIRLDRIKNMKFNKIKLGTCATLDVAYKGQEDVIKAISLLKKEGYNIEYQLVGGGDSSMLESIAKSYGVFENITIIGSLEHDQVFNWLEQIDIYVHPSKQEGLSRAIIEAMSKGCPIFGASAGGIHELIDKEYIFDKGSIKQIINIYKNFNKDKMIEQAVKNHSNSKKYLKNILYNRRKSFFKEFIKHEKPI